MHFLWTATSDSESFVMAIRAAILLHMVAVVVRCIQRRLSNRRSGRPNHAPASAQPQRVRATTRIASRKLNMTPEQAADLIERGLPKITVRSGTLNYASLTSGCMADRIRNGYA